MDRQLSDEAVAQIDAALFANRKIEAIKLYREHTGAGLKEAKDFVEAVEEQLRQTEPHRFAAPPGRGCGLNVLSLLVAAGMLFWALA